MNIFIPEVIIMSSSRRLSDVIGMVRGLQKVTTSFTENQYKSLDKYWRNSSLNHLPGKVGEGLEQTVSSMMVKQAEIQVGYLITLTKVCQVDSVAQN